MRLFFALTFAWSWFFWGVAIASGRPWTAFPTVLLYVGGGFGPPLVAILLAHTGRGAESSAEFWHRVRDARRISPAWYLAIVAVGSLPSLTATLVPTTGTAPVTGGQVASALLLHRRHDPE